MKKLGFDLILLGDPASGKDTQSDILMKKYVLKAVETGKQWRIMVKKNDHYGRWLKRTFALGHPAPVEIVKWFIKKKVTETPQSKNLIFVGNPRLKPEAQFLNKLLNQKKRIFFALYIKLPQKEIYRRVLARKKQEADTKQKTALRIAWHKNQVSKTVKYFQSLGKLKFIDGNKSIEAVARDIQKAINDYEKSRRN